MLYSLSINRHIVSPIDTPGAVTELKSVTRDSESLTAELGFGPNLSPAVLFDPLVDLA